MAPIAVMGAVSSMSDADANRLPDAGAGGDSGSSTPCDDPPGTPFGQRLAWLPLWLAIGLALRLIAAVGAELYARHKGTLCLFGDTNIYWGLARAIRTGGAYVVEQWGVPHYALRTPGYPAFLAACQVVFGEQTLAARLVQAGLGVVALWVLARLVSRVANTPRGQGTRWTVAAGAVVLAAIDPYSAGMTGLLLSEALFLPWMLLMLWGLAALWRARGREPGSGPDGWRLGVVAVLTGLCAAGAILARPSIALYVPIALLAWVVSERSKRAVVGALIVAMAVAAGMAPWWVRTYRIEGRFVPTALWVGASLYDGLSPTATGASDMRFLDEPDVRVLGEIEQDRELMRRSIEFARSNPRRALELARIKAERFWSPWPNAETLRAPIANAASAVWMLPLYALVLIGIWDRRRDARALVLLAGPLLSFAILHLVFVSSVRYRIPGMVPAMGLASIGLARLLSPWLAGRPRRQARVATWAVIGVLVGVGGGIWFAVNSATRSETLERLIEREAKRFLPTSKVIVGRVQVLPFTGAAKLDQVQVRQQFDGDAFPTLALAWMEVRHDPMAILRGEFAPQQVVVTQPTLRVKRGPDGVWNLEGLLADPWPAPPLEKLPRVAIEGGTVQLADESGVAAVLRDVSIRLEPEGEGTFRFDLTAQGDAFERLSLKGTLTLATGRLEVDGGELKALAISETVRRRLPDDWRAGYDRAGLKSGEVDAAIRSVKYDPAAADPLTYEASLWYRAGTWETPELPFALHDVSAVATLTDERLMIERAEGSNGRTTARARGTIDAQDPERGPFDLYIDVFGLEIDERLKARTPAHMMLLWDEFQPRGRVDAFVRVVRDRKGGKPGFGMTVECHDVAMNYHLFPYPLEHLMGRLVWEGDEIAVDIETVVGNQPASCKGVVKHPGPDAHVTLDFRAGAFPINGAFLAALPPDVRKVVDQFQPTGTVRVVEARAVRTPPEPGFPIGKVAVHATLDLLERCSFTWEGMPYPVSDVTGRLVLSPNRWTFEDMTGWNGLAPIEGDGWVEMVEPNVFNADVHIRAKNLPLNEQLRRALPPEWSTSWAFLNPKGTTKLDARITLARNARHERITVEPEAESEIRLKFQPVAPPGGPEPPAEVELPPMDQIRGQFVYEDGLVTMNDVAFEFRGSPVSFRTGTVKLEEGGKFALGVQGLGVRKFRMDADLRRLMPPVMAEFARRFDESIPLPMMRGDLALGWSGRAGEPAYVSWDKALVVFNGQTIRTGLPLEFLQGRLEGLRGRFDGQTFEVHGAMHLDSAHVMGQQITEMDGPIDVVGGMARMEGVKAKLLDGTLTGSVNVSLDQTPRYSAALALERADLGRLTQTLPGKQTFRGLLSGQFTLAGLGNDLRTLRGEGGFRIDQGDLGELPVLLRLVKFLRLSAATKTAFDTAAVSVRVHDGLAYLDPIELTGDAISLRGGGTMDLQGDLDLRLRIAYGRDRLRLPVISDAMREAQAQIVDIRVNGPASFPRFESEVLPGATEWLKSFGARAIRPAAVRNSGR